MEIFGLPAHPVVVHAAVVLTPLAVLLVLAFALLPSWRWASRWPALLVTLAATGAVVVAKYSGQALYDDRIAHLPPSRVTELVATHASRGDVLFWVTIAFAVMVVLAFYLLPAPSGLRGGRLDHAGRQEGWVGIVVPGALVVLGIVVTIWVVLTGDAGARAVWSSLAHPTSP
jgi:hypothetical protein